MSTNQLSGINQRAGNSQCHLEPLPQTPASHPGHPKAFQVRPTWSAEMVPACLLWAPYVAALSDPAGTQDPGHLSSLSSPVMPCVAPDS